MPPRASSKAPKAAVRGRSTTRKTAAAASSASPAAPAPPATAPAAVASPSPKRTYLEAARGAPARAAAASHALPAWVSQWFLVASIVVLIDSVYVLGIWTGAARFVPAPIMKLWAMYGEVRRREARGRTWG